MPRRRSRAAPPGGHREAEPGSRWIQPIASAAGRMDPARPDGIRPESHSMFAPRLCGVAGTSQQALSASGSLLDNQQRVPGSWPECEQGVVGPMQSRTPTRTHHKKTAGNKFIRESKVGRYRTGHKQPSDRFSTMASLPTEFYASAAMGRRSAAAAAPLTFTGRAAQALAGSRGFTAASVREAGLYSFTAGAAKEKDSPTVAFFKDLLAVRGERGRAGGRCWPAAPPPRPPATSVEPRRRRRRRALTAGGCVTSLPAPLSPRVRSRRAACPAPSPRRRRLRLSA